MVENDRLMECLRLLSLVEDCMKSHGVRRGECEEGSREGREEGKKREKGIA